MIGCQPSQSAVMSASVKAGRILDTPSGDTLSDGTAGGVEENSVSLQNRIWTHADRGREGAGRAIAVPLLLQI